MIGLAQSVSLARVDDKFAGDVKELQPAEKVNALRNSNHRVLFTHEN